MGIPPHAPMPGAKAQDLVLSGILACQREGDKKMPKFELNKSIEVAKLNKRTGIPTGEPLMTIPFGGVVEDPELDYDFGKFTYHGEIYRCPSDVLKAAMETKSVGQPAPAVAAAPAEAAPSAAEERGLWWEQLKSSHHPTERAKVPGGWLVAIGSGSAVALTFYPDADHQWDGKALAG